MKLDGLMILKSLTNFCNLEKISFLKAMCISISFDGVLNAMQ